jgi:hypothetical protein
VCHEELHRRNAETVRGAPGGVAPAVLTPSKSKMYDVPEMLGGRIGISALVQQILHELGMSFSD